MAVLLLVGAAGCGDAGEETAPSSIDREKVAGVYQLIEFSFDPRGSLPKVDILDRLPSADRPELVISHSDDTFQSIARDPATGWYNVVEGEYLFRNNVLRLTFKKAEDAQWLLLPRRVDFSFDEANSTLTYHANTGVSLSILRNLVSEYEKEQLPDPVIGELLVIFKLDRR